MAQETVILKVYELVKYSIPILEKLPKSQKYLLGDRIETMLLTIQENLIEAYYSKKNRAELIAKSNIHLEQLRYLIRLLFDMRYINSERYGVISEKINEVGKMCGGWLKTVQ